MAKIKSALEIALERTESVKSNKGSIGSFEAKQKGKKLANGYLEGTLSLKEELEKAGQEEQPNLRQGMFDMLISQISLPVTKEDVKRIAAAGLGLNDIIGGTDFEEPSKQLGEILDQYVEEAARYEEAIKQQFAPKLKKKEEELSRRMGREVKLDLDKDSEYIAFHNQHVTALKETYQNAIDQVREEATKLYDQGFRQAE